MAELEKEKMNSLVKELSEYHVRFIGYAKQARRELKTNLGRLFEALSFSKQIQALYVLNYAGCIGNTKENLTALTGDVEVCSFSNASEVSEMEEMMGQFGKIEEKNKHLYICAKDAVESEKDLNIGDVNVCSRCGYVLASDVPKECTICHSPSGYFRLF